MDHDLAGSSTPPIRTESHEPGSPASPRPLLSLCMIARDNEGTIRDALASAKPWVDEMIVVDTGSTDRTREIAHDLGARVETFPWCDDFAAARNQSLQYAAGRWLFWMDTDDTLPAECGEQLRAALLAPPQESEIAEDVLGLVMQVHCPSGEGAQANGAEARQSLSATVVDHVKVIRNRPGLRFEGRIHEQILPAIRKAGGRVLWTDSYVVHSGSDQSPEGIRRKLDRDLRLLRMDAKERAGHPFVLFNLGMTLVHRGEYAEARATLEACIERSTTDESHLRKAYALLIDALEQVGASSEIPRRCWEGLGRYPDDPELAFKLGRHLMLGRSWKEAIEAFQRILRPTGEQFFASIDPGIKGHKTFANLAACHEELGQLNEALGAWRTCLEDAPGFVDAWDGILRMSRRLNDMGPLVRFAEELRGKVGAQEFVLICEGLLCGAQGDFSGAVQRFEDAVEVSGSREFALNEYARFLNEHEQWEGSLAVLRKLRGLNPMNPSPHFNLGVCFHHLGRHREAIKALNAALQLRPGHPPTRALLRKCEAVLRKKSSPQDDASANRSTQVVLSVCLVRRPDPQRGVVWDESSDLAFAIDNWIHGIVENNLSAVILYDGLSDGFVAERARAGVTFMPCRQTGQYSAVDQRYWLIQEFLDSHPEVEQVFCTDLFDLTIARDPFPVLDSCGPLCVGVEPSTIGQNTWMQDMWRKVWGNPPAEALNDKPVLNAGIFGGQRENVIDLCARMQRHIESCETQPHFFDMPIFNHVLYREVGEENFWAQQEPLHSVFRGYEYERTDVAFIHK